MSQASAKLTTSNSFDSVVSENQKRRRVKTAAANDGKTLRLLPLHVCGYRASQAEM